MKGFLILIIITSKYNVLDNYSQGRLKRKLLINTVSRQLK